MNKNLLLEEYKYKFEIHSHTYPVSQCSKLNVEEFADIFIEEGYHGITLTNHFDPSYLKFSSPQKAAEYYLSDYNKLKKSVGDKLSVCLGTEIRFTGSINDYLVYGINENDIEKFYWYLNKSIDDFYKEIKNDKNIILQAHPFRDDMSRTLSVDGIEVFNLHPGHNSRISVAAKYAKENNMIVSAGSDFHYDHQRGQLALCSRNLPKDSYDIAELLKSGDYIYTLGNSIIIP